MLRRVLLLLLFLPLTVSAAAEKRVLFISSYHPGFPTFFQELAGLRAGLSGSEYQLDIEFMDSKRLGTNENIAFFHRRLQYKIAKLSAGYDLIFAAHDNAVHYLLGRGRLLWQSGRIPVVFYGINNRTLALSQNTNRLMTGVVEHASLLETVQLAKQLQPDLKNLYFLADATPSGRADVQNLQFLLPRLKKYRVELLDLSRLTFPEVFRKIAGLRGLTNALFFLAAYTDRTGIRLDFKGSLDLVRKNARIPVYHIWDNALKGDAAGGLMGGCLVSLYRQALSAARIGRRILQGTPPEQIPVVSDSPNVNTVDFRQLFRFQIPLSRVPSGSRVLFLPQSFFNKHRPVLIGAGVVIVFLLGIILGLFWNIVRRRRLQQKLQRRNRQIRRTLEEKELLLKEVHHRVKNNLQIVSSLLSLQSSNTEDPVVRLILDDSCRRIRAMALAHESLYQKKRFDRINFESYARSLLREYQSVASKSGIPLSVVMTAESPEIGIDRAIPCGLILNELLSNVVRHAFPGRSDGEVTVRFSVSGETRILEVSDDGAGFPPALLSGEGGHLGLELVRALAAQLHGVLELHNGPGARALVLFPSAAD